MSNYQQQQQQNVSSKKRKRHELTAFISPVELPDHLIHSILLKLPLRSLLRFRSLSKQWDQIISCSSFAKQHLQSLTVSTASCNVVYFVECPAQRLVHSYRITSVEYDQQPGKIIMTSSTDASLYHSFSRSLTRYLSCDGILCTIDIGYTIDISSITVRNPTTCKHRTLAWPPLLDKPADYLVNIFMGFGYDATSDDYKLVFIFQRGEIMVSKVWNIQVLSLRENKWTTIVDPVMSCLTVWHADFYGRSVALNGDLYWIALEGEQLRLMKFNLAEEKVSFKPMPVVIKTVCGRQKYYLATLKESLYMFVWKIENSTGHKCALNCKGETSAIDIWKLQGHVTWFRVFTIPTKDYVKTLSPAGFNSNGHVIMVNCLDASLVVYIPNVNRFVKVAIDKVKATQLVGFHFVQTESLLSP